MEVSIIKDSLGIPVRNSYISRNMSIRTPGRLLESLNVRGWGGRLTLGEELTRFIAWAQG